jgi:hypothetical protein
MKTGKNRSAGFCNLASRVIFACLILSATDSRLVAQGTADIVGTVTDNSSAVVANAKVTVKNLGTSLTRTQQTDASGTYAFTLLPVGDYSVTVEAMGFKTFSNPRLALATGDRARVDTQLQVGDITQSVSVEEQAVALQTDSSTVGGLITNRAVQDLPMEGRNFVRLVQLAPGATESIQVAGAGGSRVDDRRQTNAISANGQIDGANNFMLDGMDNNDRNIGTIIVKPSIDALQEVKVDTSLYPAEVGRAGGAVVNMITKSGSNAFHGTLFEFFRNDKLNAKDYFNVPQPGNPLAGQQTEYRQNQFGGSIGGPIKKDKTFFFVDYEAFRKIQGVTSQNTIPSACELGRVACNGIQQIGNFSDISTPIFDPISHLPYQNNVIQQITTPGANYAALFPTPVGCFTSTCQYINNANLTQFAHTGDARIDHRFTDNDNVFGRFSYNATDTLAPSYLPPATINGVTFLATSPQAFLNNFPSNNSQIAYNVALSYVHIFSPTLLLQLGAQGARYQGLASSLNAGIKGNDLFGGPANVNSNVAGTDGLALVQFSNGGYVNLGDGFAVPTNNYDTTYQYNGAFNWTRGRHSIKFGASVLRRDWASFQVLFKGSFAFSSAQTSSNASSTGTGGNSFASLLTGYYNQAQRNMNLVAPQWRQTEIGEFFQDNWRATRWLTLNLGVRYDFTTPETTKHNTLSNFDPTDPKTLASGQIQVAGLNGVDSSLNFPKQWNNVQPRTGFAATLGHGTVVRGGFGMNFWPGMIFSPAKLLNAPFVATLVLNQAPSTPTFNLNGSIPPVTPNTTCLVAACGAPAGSNFNVATATKMTDYKYGEVFMWNVLMEKEFAGNVVSAGYIGQSSRHLPLVIPNADTNVPTLGPGGCGLSTPVAFPSPCQVYNAQIPFVSNLQLLTTAAESNYNALQLVFQRRYQKGLTVSSSYTYSKSLSDGSSGGGACGGCAQVLNDLGRDYGPSDFMVKNRFIVTANYELPFAKNAKGAMNWVAKGWQLNGIYSYASGQPFTVLSGQPKQNSLGVTSDRPNALAPGDSAHNISQWFDTTAFRAQAFGTEGTEGHNFLSGPAGKKVDLSLFKDFSIREGAKLQFRAEVFNLTNTPSFNLPNATISAFDANGVPTQAGNFGKITAMSRVYTPRVFQLALKLVF